MPTPEDILTELEGLRIKRESLFARIQNVLDSSRTLTSENVRLFRLRIDKLVELEARFEGIQEQIIDRNSQIKVAADKLEVLNVQKACDNIIYEVRGKYVHGSDSKYARFERYQFSPKHVHGYQILST
ncbi:hypothetical protein Zmor_024330 [Zophobas morio]|uniref:Uncharacterized protein n=1 Tax=Zophobas morio TaxID=2755281 RepID=A0AA38I0P8_9CUCU|nr:hypothetical protein Zmor_024330 [Zophobas morio]